MFFILSKTLGLLLNPLVLLLLLLLIYLLSPNKSSRKKPLGISFIVLLLVFTNPFVSNQVMRWWEVAGTPYDQLKNRHSAALVLGGATASKQEPYDRVHTNQAADRMLHALDLYRRGKVKNLLLLGGSGQLAGDSVSEAQRMYRLLRLAGIPDRHLFLEESSRNTYENARNSKSILLNHGLQPPYLLVTSAFHMRRAQACFNANEVAVIPFSTSFLSSPPPYHWNEYLIPEAGALHAWQVLFKEWAGLLSYWLRGYL